MENDKTLPTRKIKFKKKRWWKDEKKKNDVFIINSLSEVYWMNEDFSEIKRRMKRSLKYTSC